MITRKIREEGYIYKYTIGHVVNKVSHQRYFMPLFFFQITPVPCRLITLKLHEKYYTQTITYSDMRF